ncbi:S1C family serine protease [Nocardioides sp. LMS-CY]|uniref:S1C family serine protease n=1 Tax=Nocardioides sp. (strain LMS-CY) TaxID=2840457 RepID=UPI001C00760C|nr:trypsin-like peptidase domain-containing protein [Nocardioides sp. LMS-CY]QWF22570.1 S1C family serine protease [Nocardioides sp. LMS-CY]
MTSPDSGSTPPPPFNPYFAAPTTPPPAGPPAGPPSGPPAFSAPPPARRTGWSWRATLAGAVAGGVLAASVAVPVTWALSHGGSVADSPSAATPQQPGTGTLPQQPGSGALPQDPFGGSRGLPYGGSTSDRTGSWSDATADQAQGVVLIDTRTTAGEAAGTGLVIDASGLVLTNYHVVEGSTQVQVTVAATGDTYDATVVGHDQEADIALLQLDGASGLTTVDVDDDGGPAVADEVTAVGNAQGQGFLSAADGSVVALDRSIDTQSEATVQGEHLTGLIQTDAYVVGGFSGGALLDDEGEVVGITTAASSGGAAQSYAVPIDEALDVAGQIEGGHQSDGVQIGPSAYLGIAIAQAGSGVAGSGVQVGQVESDSAAAQAGIEAGATITGIDDTAITSYAGLRSALATYEPGDSVTLHWTDASGGTHDAQVTLGSSPVN